MEIRPFRGWRYRVGGVVDVSPYLAPPYDILSAEDKDRLLARSQRNIVAVDLPHVPPNSVGPQAVYQQAARRLAEWQAEGLLVQEKRPVVYAYQQTFAWAGKTYTRRALVAGVRATALGQDVIAHEHTFAGPKADRLRLTQCTRMQLSPIFGVYHDPTGRAARLLSEAMSGPADGRGRVGGVSETLWAIRDEQRIAALAAALRDEPVLIADGHHRYATALEYRDGLAAGGQLPPDHEAHFVMFALVAREDSGLLLLPTHRILRNLARDFTLQALMAGTKEFSWRQVALPAGDDADAFLRPFGPGAMVFIPSGAKEAWAGKLIDPDAMARAAPDRTDTWRQLDVTVLHTLIVDTALRPWRTRATSIEYTASLPGAVGACRSGGASLAVCLQGTALASVETIALAGVPLPHKSTYFYPKLTTGWVLKPLA
ncbi:MAG: DUF1015 domain-containing protein [Phycisphaerae bacterium]|nr:DUF1015 domain-containing protein [Phycisphaerae bacterium]